MFTHNSYRREYKLLGYGTEISYSMYRRIYLLVSLSLFISCSQLKNRDTQCDFTDADFEVENMSVNGAEQIETGYIALKKPSKLQFINDSILAVADSKGQNLLWLINHKRNLTTSVLSRGEGPEDLIELTTITYPNDELNVAGLNDGKILRFDIEMDSLNIRFIGGVKVPYQPLRSVMIDDSVVFSLAPTYSGHRYNLFNMNDSTVEYIDEFPMDSIYLGAEPDNMFMQSDIDITPDGKLIVIANRFWPVIELFDVTNQKIKRLMGPVVSDAKVIKEYFGESYSYVQKPRWYMWDGVVATSNTIYIGYNGYVRRNDENDNVKDAVTKIYSFDTQGRPQKIYTFDMPILSFTVDVPS